MIDPTELERYLTYLRAVSEAFQAPAEAPFSRRLNALIDARRIARAKAGLSEAEVEAAAHAIRWAREHAAEIDAAESEAEAPFQR